VFGTFRTLLAAAVVANHSDASMAGAGPPAVFWFFCLSGFLMSLIVTGQYAERPAAFFLNRFLRLYPMYWLAFGLTIAIGLAAPSLGDTRSLVRQALYIVRVEDVRVVNPAWAVTNEICCYILIGLGVTRTRPVAAWAFAAALAVSIIVYTSFAQTIADLYFPVVGAFVPFALGGLLAQYRFSFPVLSHRMNVLAILSGMLGVFVCIAISAYAYTHGHPRTLLHVIYICLIPASVTIIGLYRLDAPVLKRADDLVGRLSYPIYLTHGLGGALAAVLLPALPTFPSTLAMTIVISILFSALIDIPVSRIRERVRGGRARKAPPASQPVGGDILAVRSAAP
jgi:peptidoglycan/LPS O-acetylase OafA/YrhL